MNVFLNIKNQIKWMIVLFICFLFVCLFFVFVLIYVTSSIALQFFVVRSGTLAFLALIVISSAL
jgi:hypothetical protein